MERANGMITVTEMAERTGLSRDRFYDLVRAGAFPPPVYRLETRRPFYPPDLQEICLSVRQTGIGFDGSPVLFNKTGSPRKTKKSKAPNQPRVTGAFEEARYRDWAAKLRYMGLQNVSVEAVASALGAFDADDDSVVLRYLVRRFTENSCWRFNDKRNEGPPQ
jgi:hypothetical protein